MLTHNISFYKEVPIDKSTWVVNLKSTKLLDCVHIWVCAVIRSNTVCKYRQTTSVIIMPSPVQKLSTKPKAKQMKLII